MTGLIQELASYAHARDPNIKIWINSSGAEPMLSNAALVNAIDGAFEEQLLPEPDAGDGFRRPE